MHVRRYNRIVHDACTRGTPCFVLMRVGPLLGPQPLRRCPNLLPQRGCSVRPFPTCAVDIPPQPPVRPRLCGYSPRLTGPRICGRSCAPPHRSPRARRCRAWRSWRRGPRGPWRRGWRRLSVVRHGPSAQRCTVTVRGGPGTRGQHPLIIKLETAPPADLQQHKLEPDTRTNAQNTAGDAHPKVQTQLMVTNAIPSWAHLEDGGCEVSAPQEHHHPRAARRPQPPQLPQQLPGRGGLPRGGLDVVLAQQAAPHGEGRAVCDTWHNTCCDTRVSTRGGRGPGAERGVEVW